MYAIEEYTAVINDKVINILGFTDTYSIDIYATIIIINLYTSTITTTYMGAWSESCTWAFNANGTWYLCLIELKRKFISYYIMYEYFILKILTHTCKVKIVNVEIMKNINRTVIMVSLRLWKIFWGYQPFIILMSAIFLYCKLKPTHYIMIKPL